MTKKEVRAQIRQHNREMLVAENRERWSQSIIERIRRLDIFADAKRIGLYHALPDEPDLAGLLREQLPFDLADGSAIRLTVARYYTPSGRSIQKPYSSGVDENYYQDLRNRFNHGELYSADSIPSLGGKIFKTAGGREVYGGGGIIPDIFIPLDTAGLNSYMMKVEDSDLIPRYAFLYSDANRVSLSHFKTVEELGAYLDRTYLIFDFASFAQRYGIPMRTSLINEARNRIKKYINAYIAMNFFDLQGYYQLLLHDDPFILQAISLIKEGKTFPLIYDQKGSQSTDPAA